MGAKIDIFLNSFNDGLLMAIDKNNNKKTNFDSLRYNAIKIAGNRTGNWPNNSSIITIGDLFGYVFPVEGGIKNEPEASFGGGLSPEYLTYLDDINSEKKIYNELNKLYSFGNTVNKRIFTLKEKGGAQFWFDYFMYLLYTRFLKSDYFLKKIKESSEYSQLLPSGGSSVNEYNTFDLFDGVIFSDGNINDYLGLHKFLTGNLSTDELLYDAFIEAGDNYEGPYTKDIKEPVDFFTLLGSDLIQKTPVVVESTTPIVAESTTPTTEPADISTYKIKLIINDIPDNFTIQAKTDMPLFSVYVGDKTKEIYDDFNNLPELDSEYIDGDFKGAEELAVTVEQFKMELAIANGQMDSDSNLGKIGDPVDIKPVSSFNELLILAGKCARELGKNSKVKYENLKKAYTDGIHGLCPQGTQAILYAMSGVKSLGQISGNADYFSFKNGGKSSFSKTGYYDDKVRIDISYTNDKSRWQVGDVVAMGYLNGKPYGHIQVWTGSSWMSDFKQGNYIQKRNVDWNTAALWRLNKKGIDAVNKQLNSVV